MATWCEISIIRHLRNGKIIRATKSSVVARGWLRAEKEEWTGRGQIFRQVWYYNDVCWVAQSCSILCDPMDSRLLCPCGCSRQEYWSGLPYPLPGDFPNSGIEPRSPALQADSLPYKPPGNCFDYHYILQCRCGEF